KVTKDKSGRQLFFEAGSMETLINMVKSSSGFTILPYLTCETLSEKDKKLLREFKGEIPTREISFVTGPLSMKSSIEKALVEVFEENLPAALRKAPKRSEILSIN